MTDNDKPTWDDQTKHDNKDSRLDARFLLIVVLHSSIIAMSMQRLVESPILNVSTLLLLLLLGLVAYHMVFGHELLIRITEYTPGLFVLDLSIAGMYFLCVRAIIRPVTSDDCAIATTEAWLLSASLIAVLALFHWRASLHPGSKLVKPRFFSPLTFQRGLALVLCLGLAVYSILRPELLLLCSGTEPHNVLVGLALAALLVWYVVSNPPERRFLNTGDHPGDNQSEYEGHGPVSRRAGPKSRNGSPKEKE